MLIPLEHIFDISAKDKYQGHVIDQMNKAIQVEKLPFFVSFGLEMLIPNSYIREIPTRMINPTKSITDKTRIETNKFRKIKKEKDYYSQCRQQYWPMPGRSSSAGKDLLSPPRL